MLQIAIRLPFGWYIGRDTPSRQGSGARTAALRDIAELSPRLKCDIGFGSACRHESVADALDYRIRFLL